MFNSGDVLVLNFPGVTGAKRRPVAVISSDIYHASRPDVIVGLIASQNEALGPTDYIAGLGAGWLEGAFCLSRFLSSYLMSRAF